MPRAVVLVALLLAAPPAGAAPPPLLARLAKETQGLTALRGEFTQRNKMKLFKKALDSRGRFAFEKSPRRIRWEYVTPDPSTLILDGDAATLRMPGAAPQRFDLAADATMRAIFDQLMVLFGVGLDERGLADYEVSAGGSDAAPTLVLTPKPGTLVARTFLRIDLRIDGKSWLVDSILLTERGGDEKEIRFAKVERNPRLAADAFAP